MAYSYPVPQDIGIRVPRHLIEERYQSGFSHALEGGQITAVEHLRLSFRAGFRAGKLYLQEMRRSRGILDFPLRAKIRILSVE